MNTAMQWTTRLAMIVLLIVTVGATAQTGAGAAPRVRTGDACLDDHYTGFARFESPGTAFASEEACLGYANGGGLIVALMPGYAPVIEVYFRPTPLRDWCALFGGLEGFVPGASYTVTYHVRSIDGSGQPILWHGWTTTVQTNKYGTASLWVPYVEGYGLVLFQAGTVDGTVSDWVLLEC